MPPPNIIYEITSLVEKKPVVGINPPLPPSAGLGPVILTEPVHIDGTGIWRFTQQDHDPNIYQLSIAGFEYTGVSDKNVVIATNTANDNKLWYVEQVGREEFIIALAENRSLGWTVGGLGPGTNIVLDTLPPRDIENETLPNPFYHLFKLSGLLQK